MNLVSRGQRTQLRGCNRKLRYPDKYSADVEIAIIKDSRHARAPERLHSYRCPYCDGWHIGHAREGKKVYR